LLLEKQSTNLITYSENFDQAYWPHYTTGSGTVTKILNNAISPDGTQNADEIRLTRSTLTDDALTYQVQGVGSATYSRTIYLKAARSQDVGKKIQIWSYNGTVVQNIYEPVLTADWVRFDAGTTTGALVEILSFGYLSSSTFPTTSGTDVRFYAWGAQGEASSYPTSYIPTTSSSATRVAEGSFTSGLSALIGQTEGTLFAIVSSQQAGSLYNWLNLSDNTVNNWVFIGKDSTKWRAYVKSNGSVIFDNSSISITNNTFTKIALAYKSGDIALYINGTQIATSSGTFTFSGTLSKVSIGDISNVVGDNAQYSEILVSKTRLTNAELASLTTI